MYTKRIKSKYYEHLHSSKVDNVDEMGKLIEKLKLLQIPQKQTNLIALDIL